MLTSATNFIIPTSNNSGWIHYILVEKFRLANFKLEFYAFDFGLAMESKSRYLPSHFGNLTNISVPKYH